jgi:hypothetical protein
LLLILAGLAAVDPASAKPDPGDLRLRGTAGQIEGDVLEVSYRNPLTDQTVRTDLRLGGRIPEPARGERVDLIVDPDDPEAVALAGDSLPGNSDVFLPFLLLGVLLAWWGLRWSAVRRAERTAAGDGTAFALLGALEVPRWPGRRPVLHLWAVDAATGAEAICAVPVITTGGLPIGTHAFPVEVKGSPRSLGRVVARAGGTVLWPAARCLISTRGRRPEAVLEAPADDPAIPAGPDAGNGRPATGFLAAHVLPATALAASVAVVAIVAALSLVKGADARRLSRDGTRVVAEVVDRHQATVSVTYRLPGDDGKRRGTVPVSFPADHKTGLRLPAVVDPEQPGHLRFVREPYDVAEPVMWASLPAVAVGWWLASAGLRWRRSGRAAAAGPWRVASARTRAGRSAEYLLLGPADGRYVHSEVRIASRDRRLLQEDWRTDGTIPLEMAGGTDPGDPIALRRDGRILAVTSGARIPRLDGPLPPPAGA